MFKSLFELLKQEIHQIQTWMIQLKSKSALLLL